MRLFCLTALLAIVSFDLSAGEKLRVVTTIQDLKSITEAIGGEKVKVSSIALPNQDPHFIRAKPSYMLRAKKADLWVRIGLQLEIGWEPLILDGSRNSRIRVGSEGHLDCSAGIIRLEVPTKRIDRSMGDIHPLGNPHYWLDPYNGRVIAGNIAKRLSKLRPENRDYFNQRLKEFLKKLDSAYFGEELVEKYGGDFLWRKELADTLGEFLKAENASGGGWRERMKPFWKTRIITYHRSWSYFANRFHLKVIDELEPKPGIPPSPKHIAEVIRKIKAVGAKILLMEPFYSMKAPRLVNRKTGIKIVISANTVGGQPEAKDYISMLGNVVKRVVSALKEE